MAELLVIGGTGYAGAAIVKEAARRGHSVQSLSRKLPEVQQEGVTYLQGDARFAGPTIAAADVVVAALSPRSENAGALPEIYAEIARYAEAANTRFIAIGGFSSTRPAPGAPRIAEGDTLNPLFAGEAREMNSILMELLERPGSLDWLFVSPAAAFGAYAPGERLGHYRVGTDVAIFDANGQSAISGEDFAAAVVDEIESHAHANTQIHFAY